jgi:hypothetical protein
MSHEPQVLFEFCAPHVAVIVAKERFRIRTEGSWQVLLVHGLIVAHYDIHDRAVEEYSMFTPLGSGYAHQNEIALAFRYSMRSVRRYEQSFDLGGLHALGRTQKRHSRKVPKEAEGRDRKILHL